MAKENEFLKNAAEKGLIDERKIAVAADVACTNGNNGRAWIFLNGDTMRLYAFHGTGSLGECLECLNLKKCRVLKSSSFVLMSYLKLQDGGQIYMIKNFGNAKNFVAAVKASCQ